MVSVAPSRPWRPDTTSIPRRRRRAALVESLPVVTDETPLMAELQAGRASADRAAGASVPASDADARHHGGEPEGRRRQDDDHRQPRGRAGAGGAERPRPRQRPAGQRVDGPRASSTARGRRRSTRCWSTARRWPRRCRRARTSRTSGACPRRSTCRAPRSSWSRWSRARPGCGTRSTPTSSGASANGQERIDYVFVDCPPSLGLLTVNAFVVAREVLIPIQCEYYALEGLSQLLKTIQLIQAHLNPRPARLDDPAHHVRRADEPRAAGGDRGPDALPGADAAHDGAALGPHLRGAELRPDGDDLRPGLVGSSGVPRGGPRGGRAGCDGRPRTTTSTAAVAERRHPPSTTHEHQAASAVAPGGTVSEKRRGLGRGLGALIPTGLDGQRPTGAERPVGRLLPRPEAGATDEAAARRPARVADGDR